MSGDHVHSILPGMEGEHRHPEITRRLAAIEKALKLKAKKKGTAK